MILAWSAATVLAWIAARRLQRALGSHPLANPVVTTTAILLLALWLTGTSTDHYARAASPLTAMLAPATVALGVPLAANLDVIRQRLGRILLAVSAGLATSAITGALLAKLLGGGSLAIAMLPKAATTPIALAVATSLGGNGALAATFAVLGGVVVAAALRPVLGSLGIEAEDAVGLAAGVAGSGIGAASVAPLGPRYAALAATGVGLTGLGTALAARPIAALLGLT